MNNIIRILYITKIKIMFNLQQRKLILNEYLRVSYLKNDNQVFILSLIAKQRFKNWQFDNMIDDILSYYIDELNLTEKKANYKLNNKIQIL